MNIDKERLIKDLRDHKARMEWNCSGRMGERERGYLDAINFTLRLIDLQPESGIGQVAFKFDE